VLLLLVILRKSKHRRAVSWQCFFEEKTCRRLSQTTDHSPTGKEKQHRCSGAVFLGDSTEIESPPCGVLVKTQRSTPYGVLLCVFLSSEKRQGARQNAQTTAGKMVKTMKIKQAIDNTHVDMLKCIHSGFL